jgi:hypothetical protein
VIRYTVEVSCRKRGAIGAWSRRRFVVSAPEGTNLVKVADYWLGQFGDIWELNHIVSIEHYGPF